MACPSKAIKGSVSVAALVVLAAAAAPAPTARAAEPKKDSIDLGDVFGFTVPSDITGAGEREFAHEAVGRFGRTDGTYRVLDQKTQLGFGINDWLALTPGLLSTWASIADPLDPHSGLAVTGAAIEIKAKLLDRDRDGMGFALLAEPAVGWRDGETGDQVSSRGVEFRAAFDWALVPQRLFAGVNLAYGLESSRHAGLTEEASDLSASAALAYRCSDAFFVGAEARYARAYDGLGLGSLLGEAAFLGPALFVKPNDRISITLTWSPQVWGRENGGSGNLDLVNFERHESKLKVAIPF